MDYINTYLPIIDKVLTIMAQIVGIFSFFALITPSKKNKTKIQKLGNLFDAIGINPKELFHELLKDNYDRNILIEQKKKRENVDNILNHLFPNPANIARQTKELFK